MWLSKYEWKDTLALKTLRDRISRYKKYAAPEWTGVPLTKIDPTDVRAFNQKLKDDEVCGYTTIALKGGSRSCFQSVHLVISQGSLLLVQPVLSRHVRAC